MGVYENSSDDSILGIVRSRSRSGYNFEYSQIYTAIDTEKMETKSYTVDKAAILKLNSNSSVDNSNLYTSNNILVFKIT